jgi:hypothetical protein
VRASSSRPLPWCSSLQSLLWLSFCRHKPFSRYPLLPPPPSPPPGLRAPGPSRASGPQTLCTACFQLSLLLSDRRIRYTLAHSGAYECRGIPGTSASSRFMFKCVNGNWTLHEVPAAGFSWIFSLTRVHFVGLPQFKISRLTRSRPRIQ